MNLVDVLLERKAENPPASDAQLASRQPLSAPVLDASVFEQQPDMYRTLCKIRNWHSRLRQALRTRRRVPKESYFALVSPSIR